MLIETNISILLLISLISFTKRAIIKFRDKAKIIIGVIKVLRREVSITSLNFNLNYRSLIVKNAKNQTTRCGNLRTFISFTKPAYNKNYATRLR